MAPPQAAPETPVELKSAARRAVLTVLAIVGSVGIALLAASRSDLTGSAVAELVSRLSAPSLIAACVAMTVGFVCLALRWRALILAPEPPPVLPLTALMVIGTMLHFAVPGPVGELAAATLAARRFGIGVENAFAAGVQARLIGLGMAGAMAVLLYLFGDLPLPEGTDRWIGLATLAIAVIAVGVIALAVAPQLLATVSERTVGRVRLLQPVHASIVRFADAMAAIGRLGWRRYAIGAGWALAGHGCVTLGIAIAAYGLGDRPNLAGLVFTYAASTSGAVVMFALPGSQVGWDAMFVLLLATAAAVPTPDAVALTLLVRAQQLIIILLGAIGLVAWSRGK